MGKYFNGISTSTDFKTWTLAIEKSYNTPSWGANIVLLRNSNLIIGNTLYCLFTTLKNDQITVGRIGLMKLNLDTMTYTTSTGYINAPHAVDDTTSDYSYAQIYKYGSTTYILLDILTTGHDWETRIYKCSNLTTCNNNLSDLSLVYEQSITRSNNMFGAWNNRALDGVRYHEMFEYNNELYLFIEGNSPDTRQGQYGNSSNTIGLYKKNKLTGLFEQFYSNPLLINPVYQDWSYAYRDHMGMITVMNINNELYALMSGHNGTLNSYRVYPVKFNLATREENLQFRINNNL